MTEKTKALIYDYINELNELYKTGDAREHAYRPAFKKLIESLKPDINAINEPAYKGANAPDFLFKKGETPIANAECKDVNVDIHGKDPQAQARRYAAAFGRILLTNYYDFEFLSESGEVINVSIAKNLDNQIKAIEENFEKFANLITDYLTPSYRTIKSAKKLAVIMAHKARMLRDNALASLSENPNSDIYKQYETFKEFLIRDLSEKDFADMYAQTIVYGLFVARYFDPSLPTFSRHEAQDLIPNSNPLLKKFFAHVAGIDYDPKIAWLVDSLIEAYLSADVFGLMHKEFIKKEKDPVLHFYETFLAEYDKGLRKNRGVYYTPMPVVSFIVRSIDQILKTKFNLPKGLADTSMVDHKFKTQGDDARNKDGMKRINEKIHKVQILDPAAGTGTFLLEVILEIYDSFAKKKQEGSWPKYVEEHLLPRLHGFELMMTSYIMAHLNLGVTLKESGYEGDNRISIWLTNSLEESVHDVPNLFMGQWLTEESLEASRIKSELPIMVVMGNPPYSGESFNKNYKGHDVYKVEPGGEQKLNEKNSKWINDDYVKFIRFAEHQIEKTGEGVVSFITPHGYLDNPTFRGMRWHLMKTFDEIYVLDLHGNSNKKETTPEGGKDENVFGIKTGTAIILAIKKGENGKKPAKVYHAEFYGKQKEKYEQLDESSWSTLKWKKLSPIEPNLYFVQFDNEVKQKYDKGFSISDLFIEFSLGILSKKDKFITDINKNHLIERLEDFIYSDLSDNEIALKYGLKLKDKDKWNLPFARNKIKNNDIDLAKIRVENYRVFDKRYIYYDKDFVARLNTRILDNIYNHNNYYLCTTRQMAVADFAHIFIGDTIPDQCYISTRTKEGGYVFPLYLYSEDGSKAPNLNSDVVKKIESKLDLIFTYEESVKELGDFETPSVVKTLDTYFTPENILDYIYAVLHSPSYREKYKEFLKIDFPRVPYPKDKTIFRKLVKLGRELRELHLLESPKVEKFITGYQLPGSNVVEKRYPKYENGNVYINEAQYFDKVPEIVWNFYIGGYQPTQKWLKDRRERELSLEDIEHYQQMIVALNETVKLMGEIDRIFKA